MAALDFLALFAVCAPQVHPVTLEALIAAESSYQTFAVHVNGVEPQPPQPASKVEATALLTRLLNENKSVDAGLTQINSRNFAALGLTPETVFDPCTNIAKGAQILTENYVDARKKLPDDEALKAALSAYNTGNQTAGIKNGYVDRVQSKVGFTVPALKASDTPATPTDTQPTETPVRLARSNPANPEWSTFSRTSTARPWDVYSRK